MNSNIKSEYLIPDTSFGYDSATDNKMMLNDSFDEDNRLVVDCPLSLDEKNHGKNKLKDFSSVSMVPRKSMYEMMDTAYKPLKKMKPFFDVEDVLIPELNKQFIMELPKDLVPSSETDSTQDFDEMPLNLTMNTNPISFNRKRQLSSEKNILSKRSRPVKPKTISVQSCDTSSILDIINSVIPPPSVESNCSIQSTNNCSVKSETGSYVPEKIIVSKRNIVSDMEVAYNVFVRRIVDECLDRCVTLSHQPKYKLTGLEAMCTRQFPQIDPSRHRGRIRSYLKACRRNSKKNNGSVIMKGSTLLVTNDKSRQLVLTAYNNEIEEVHKMNQLTEENLKEDYETNPGKSIFATSLLSSSNILSSVDFSRSQCITSQTANMTTMQPMILPKPSNLISNRIMTASTPGHSTFVDQNPCSPANMQNSGQFSTTSSILVKHSEIKPSSIIHPSSVSKFNHTLPRSSSCNILPKLAAQPNSSMNDNSSFMKIPITTNSFSQAIHSNSLNCNGNINLSSMNAENVSTSQTAMPLLSFASLPPLQHNQSGTKQQLSQNIETNIRLQPSSNNLQAPPESESNQNSYMTQGIINMLKLAAEFLSQSAHTIEQNFLQRNSSVSAFPTSLNNLNQSSPPISLADCTNLSNSVVEELKSDLSQQQYCSQNQHLITPPQNSPIPHQSSTHIVSSTLYRHNKEAVPMSQNNIPPHFNKNDKNDEEYDDYDDEDISDTQKSNSTFDYAVKSPQQITSVNFTPFV